MANNHLDILTSNNFNTDLVLVSPWIDDEIVPMDVYTASSLGNYDVVRDFVQSDEKGTINIKNRGGWSPLMYAAYVGHETVVNLLLEEGKANVDVRTDATATTALMFAASCGNEGVVYFLLHNGADINAMDNNGCTALVYATLQGHQNVVKMFLDNGADLEKRESIHGLTPLLMAAKEGHEGIFNLILNSGANVKAKTATGDNARQLALNNGHMAVVNLIDMEAFRYQPNAMVRSEAGLGGEDFLLHPELGLSPVDARADRWIYQHGSPVFGIKDGPKAFAWLRDQQTSQQVNPPCIPPTSLSLSPSSSTGGVDIKPQFPTQIRENFSSSPKLIPQSPASYSNSYEDHFFAHSGRTVKDSSLNERLLKMGIHDNGIVSPRSRSSFSHTPEYPLLSEFLQDHNLEKYLPIFEEQEVDFETLLTLNDADLKEVGIHLFGPRRKIATALANWKANQEGNKVTISSLQNEVSDLKIQLQETMLQLHHQQLQLKQEKDLRNIVEGCVLEEQAKNQQANEKIKNLSSKVKQSLPELEEVSKILNHLCDKTNDSVTKEVFSQLASSLDKITPILKEAINSDNIQPRNTK